MTKEFESFHSVARLVSSNRCETVFREYKKDNFTRYARTNIKKLVIDLNIVSIKKLEVKLALQFTRSSVLSYGSTFFKKSRYYYRNRSF